MIIDFLFNTAIFFLVFNFSWMMRKGWQAGWVQTLDRIFWPAIVGATLTLVDSLRIMFVYQVLIFVGLLILFNWYRRRWR